ncbi:MAG: GNAT family N-acetyltransferase [Nitratireductor sp.]
MNMLFSKPGQTVEAVVETAGTEDSPDSVRLAERLDISVSDRIESAEGIWRALEAEGTASVYQRYEWTQASLSTIESEEHRSPFIVTGTIEGRPAFLLPLAVKGGYIRKLSWIGGSHVNFSMGLFSREFLDSVQPGDMARIMQRVCRMVPGVGYVKLCCQPENWRGHDNPMLDLPHQRAMNPAFMMTLNEGFDAALARGNAKRKRKKFRQQCRIADDAGGWKFLVPTDVDGISRLLDIFIEQKSRRLREKGITDIFGDRKAQRFLLRLAMKSLRMEEPLLQFYGLEINGKVRAVFGGGVHQRHLSGYFSSISTDEFTAMSPGEMLLWLTAEHACNQGMACLDLGGGDERYKRSWCDTEIGMFDVILPVSSAGYPFVAASRLANWSKRLIRENTYAWRVVGILRQARSRLQHL